MHSGLRDSISVEKAIIRKTYLYVSNDIDTEITSVEFLFVIERLIVSNACVFDFGIFWTQKIQIKQLMG